MKKETIIILGVLAVGAYLYFSRKKKQEETTQTTNIQAEEIETTPKSLTTKGRNVIISELNGAEIKNN